jgi:hypothetical protein
MIFPNLADDSHDYLKYLAMNRNWSPPRVLDTPPTSTRYPFQAQDRMGAVKALWDGMIKPSWRAFRNGSFNDKKVWATGFIHGTSGVGKTRFNLELLGLFGQVPRLALLGRAS